jgi:hypothetical protein
MVDLYKKDLDAHEMSFDAPPDKRTTRKYKRRERQRGKKECRKYFDGTAEHEWYSYDEYIDQQDDDGQYDE